MKRRLVMHVTLVEQASLPNWKLPADVPAAKGAPGMVGAPVPGVVVPPPPLGGVGAPPGGGFDVVPAEPPLPPDVMTVHVTRAEAVRPLLVIRTTNVWTPMFSPWSLTGWRQPA